LTDRFRKRFGFFMVHEASATDITAPAIAPILL